MERSTEQFSYLTQRKYNPRKFLSSFLSFILPIFLTIYETLSILVNKVKVKDIAFRRMEALLQSQYHVKFKEGSEHFKVIGLLSHVTESQEQLTVLVENRSYSLLNPRSFSSFPENSFCVANSNTAKRNKYKCMYPAHSENHSCLRSLEMQLHKYIYSSLK